MLKMHIFIKMRETILNILTDKIWMQSLIQITWYYVQPLSSYDLMNFIKMYV